MEKFMMVCTFKQGTVMSDVYAMVAEEQAKASELQATGKIGAIYLATLTRGTVFIETFAKSEEEATATVMSLPMSIFWDLDVFPLAAPGKPTTSA
jgi:muconolactone delta-isomerase